LLYIVSNYNTILFKTIQSNINVQFFARIMDVFPRSRNKKAPR